MKRQPIRWPFLLLMIFGVSVPLMAAAVLQKKTLKSWDTYVQLTEKRITSELQGNAGFLRVELVKPAVASKMRAQLRAGNVYVEQLRTVDAAGHEVHGDDG